MDVFIFIVFCIEFLQANSVDSNQMSHSMVSNRGVHDLTGFGS